MTLAFNKTRSMPCFGNGIHQNFPGIKQGILANPTSNTAKQKTKTGTVQLK